MHYFNMLSSCLWSYNISVRVQDVMDFHEFYLLYFNLNKRQTYASFHSWSVLLLMCTQRRTAVSPGTRLRISNVWKAHCSLCFWSTFWRKIFFLKKYCTPLHLILHHSFTPWTFCKIQMLKYNFNILGNKGLRANFPWNRPCTGGVLEVCSGADSVEEKFTLGDTHAWWKH